MKKIPTLFKRDPDDMKRVLPTVNPECQWVLDGEGMATHKYDGTCCLVRDGKLYKRRELKPDAPVPADMEIVDTDEITGKRVGWVPVGDGPDDRWHRDALAFYDAEGFGPLPDGTYELIGPKVQGNPEGAPGHRLMPHGNATSYTGVPRTFDRLRAFMVGFEGEGLVWHHPDGRMAKLKRKDFA